MKTASVILFTMNLLRILYTGFTKVTQEKSVDLEENEITKEKQHVVNWQPYIGVGMMVVGGAFLILGRKKSLTT